MERPPAAADGPAAPCRWTGPLSFLPLLGLVAWQGWMTLGLFGREDPWPRCLDDQPLLAGRHPLHLYHGSLGAQSFYDRGTLCCFDPNFCAGYPKTPVFDGGSRPAELFLILGGGAYQPAAYKVGLLVCWLLVPFVLATAARGAGLGGPAACLATALGLLVWWGTPCRNALEAGDVDLLLGSLAALAHACQLLAFHRNPGLLTWLGLLLTGWLGWFTQPLLLVLLVPLLLLYYLSIGARHVLAWHLALLAALAGGVAGNLFWLSDWVAYWWIRAPLQLGIPEVTHRNLRSVWNASLWGTPADRVLAMALLAAAVIGAAFLQFRRDRVTVRLLGLGVVGFVLAALGGISAEPMSRLGLSQLLLPGLLFAVPLAAHGIVGLFDALGKLLGGPYRGVALGGGVLAALGLLGHEEVTAFAIGVSDVAPLAVGLTPERQELVATIAEKTTPEGRILWEDRSGPAKDCWTALLPVLTGRAYLGGLDPDTPIEHAYAGLHDQALAGRPLANWNDAELDEFCRRYNVGWVVCWSPAAVARFQAWAGAEEAAPVHDSGPGYLFAVRRAPSFVLHGQAHWLHADCRHVALGDLVPAEQGRIVLSLHHQAGMVASPARVQVERELDPRDPIPFVRLRVPGPVARVTLTWERR